MPRHTDDPPRKRVTHLTPEQIRRMGRAIPADYHRGHTNAGELAALGLQPTRPERERAEAQREQAYQNLRQPTPAAAFDYAVQQEATTTDKDRLQEYLAEKEARAKEVREMIHFILREEGFPHSWDEVLPTVEKLLGGGRDMMTPGDKARPLGGEIIVSLFNLPGAIQAFRDVFSDFLRGEVDGWTALAGFGMLPILGPLIKSAGRASKYSLYARDAASVFGNALDEARAAGLPITKENLYHWSAQQLETVRPAMAGSNKGIRGEERARLARLEPEFRQTYERPQSFFYNRPDKVPESGLGPWRHDVLEAEGSWLDMDEFEKTYNRVKKQIEAGEPFDRMSPQEELAAKVYGRLEELGRPLDQDMRATLTEALAMDAGYTGLRRGDVNTSFYEAIPTRVRTPRGQLLQTLEGSVPRAYNVADVNVMDRTGEGMTSRRFSTEGRETEPWILITAENPRGETLSDAKNAERTAELRKRLENSGRRFIETQGGYIDGKTGQRIQGENGFIVFDVEPIDDALVEGMRYEQNYMLTSDGLIDVKERTIQPARGIRLNADDAEFYSDIKFPEGDDVRFALDLEDEAQPLFNRRLGEPGSGVERGEMEYLLGGAGVDAAIQREVAELRTQRQYAQMTPDDLLDIAEQNVRKRFRDWFGQSQADEIFQHGTPSDFDEVDMAYANDIGFHIGTRGQASQRLEQGRQYRFGEDERVKDIVPRAERPLRMADLGSWNRDHVINELTQVERQQGARKAVEPGAGREMMNRYADRDDYGIAHRFRNGYVDAEELDPSQVEFLRRRGVNPVEILDGGGQPMNNGGFYDWEDLDALRKELHEEVGDYVRDATRSTPENAVRYETGGGRQPRHRQAENEWIRKTLQDAGFDSVVYKNEYELPTAMVEAGAKPDLNRHTTRQPDGIWGDDGEFYEWEDSMILLDPNQAKSPDNLGGFSRSDNRLMYGIGAAVAADQLNRSSEEDLGGMGIDPSMAALLMVGMSPQQRRAIVDRLLGSHQFRWRPSLTSRGIFNRSLLTGDPLGPQFNFLRPVNPGSKVQALARDVVGSVEPQDWDRIRRLTERGLSLGGRTYYDPRALDDYLRMLSGPLGNEMRDFWGPAMAATSPQAALPVNLSDASILGVMQAQGVDLPTALTMYSQQFPRGPRPKMMRREAAFPAMEALRDAAPGVGSTTALKTASYGENLAGNLAPLTGDTHAAAMMNLFQEDPAIRKRFGSRSLEDVAYGPFEQAFIENVSEPMGIGAGTAQAGLWYGGGPLTGLISPWGDITQHVENSAYLTAQALGIAPTRKNLQEIIDKVLTGQGFFAPSYQRDQKLLQAVGYPHRPAPPVNLKP